MEFEPIFFNPVKPYETEDIVENCITTYSLRFSYQKPLLHYDTVLVRSLLKENSNLHRMEMLSLLFDFNYILKVPIDPACFIGCLQQLFAFGYFAPQLFKQGRGDFIFQLPLLIKAVKTGFKEHADLAPLASTAVGYALTAIASRYRDIDVTDQSNAVYLEIAFLASQYIRMPSSLAPQTFGLFHTFFSCSLFGFPSQKYVSKEIQDLFRDIVRAVTVGAKSSLKQNDTINFVALVAHLLTFLQSPYDLTNRSYVYGLVVTVATESSVVRAFALEPENLNLIGQFIAATINAQGLEFPATLVPAKKKISLPDKAPVGRNQRIMTVTFSEDVPLLPAEQRKFSDVPANIPTLYQTMKISDLSLNLMDIATKLCAVQDDVAGLLMMSVLGKEPTPAVFYFCAFWLYALVKLGKAPVIHKLQSVLKEMLNCAYERYRAREMMDFMCQMFLFMLDNVSHETSFLIPLLLEVDDELYTSTIDASLVNCTCRCIIKGALRVTEVLQKVSFADRMANLFFCLRNYHIMAIEEQKDPSIIEQIEVARLAVYRMVDVILSVPTTRVVFFRSHLFIDALNQTIFEPPLNNYAIYQLGLVLTTLSAEEPAMEQVFKFFVTVFNATDFLEIKTALLDMISESCVTNSINIAKAFLDTKFFEPLIQFIGAIKDQSAAYRLLDLFRLFSQIKGEMRRYISEADLFSRLYDLFVPFFEGGQTDQELLDRLWMIVHENSTQIKNADPLPLLFRLVQKKKDSLMSFLKRVTDICEKDANSALEVNNSELPAYLIKSLYEYRKKQSGDDVFDATNTLISSLFLFSMKGKDMVLYLQNLTALPGNFRPFFTIDLLPYILSFFQTPFEAPSAILNMNGQTSVVANLSKADLGNQVGFSFFIDIEFLDGCPDKPGDLLYIETLERNSFRLMFHKRQLSFEVRTAGIKTLNGVFEYPFVNGTWTKILLQYNNKRTLQLFIHGKEHVHVELSKPGIQLKGGIHTSYVAKDMNCNIGQLFFSKSVFDATFIRDLCRFPRPFVTSFLSKEADEFPGEFRRLFGFGNDVVFSFNAAVSYHGNLVNMAKSGGVATTNGLLFGYSPQAKAVMHSVGGVVALLPLFEQLDMPVRPAENSPVSYNLDLTFMRFLLEILRSVLAESPDNQEEFAASNGFSCLGYLLSRISSQHFTEESVESLKKLLHVVETPELFDQLLYKVFLNQYIWLYLPTEIQMMIATTVLDICREKNYVIPFSNIIHLMRVCFWNVFHDESICLFNSTKTDPVTKEVLTRNSENMAQIRNCFWKLARFVARSSFTENDAVTLIHLSFDMKDVILTIETLAVLITLVTDRNPVMLKLLKTDFTFTSFFPLVISENEFIRAQCIHLFLNFNSVRDDDREKFLAPFTQDEWFTAIVSTIRTSNNTTVFPDVVFGYLYGMYDKRRLVPRNRISSETGSVELEIKFPAILSLCVLSIASMPEDIALIYMVSLWRAISLNARPVVTMSDWDLPFVMFLFQRIPKPTESPDSACLMCIQILSTLYGKCTQLTQLPAVINLFSARTKVDMSHIMRIILLDFIERSLIGNQLVITHQFMYDLYRIIFEFMFLLPDSDVYDKPTFTGPPERNNSEAVSFQELNQIRYHGEQPKIVFTYGTRTDPDGTWIDWKLADKFLFVLSRSPNLFTVKPSVTVPEKQLHPLFMYSFTLAVALQHTKYFNVFVHHIPRLTSLIPNEQKIDSTLAVCFSHLTAGLIKGALAKNAHQSAAAYLFECTKQYSKVIQGQFSESLFETENLQRFMGIIFTQTTFIQKILKKFVDSEVVLGSYAKRLTKSITKSIQAMAKANERFANQFSDLNVFNSSQDLVKRSDQIHYRLFEYASQLRNNYYKSSKQYRELWRSLSSERGPWCQPDRQIQHHYKLDMSCSANHTRGLFKENFSFTDHQDASLMRDLGNAEDAMEKYQDHLKAQRMKEFEGDQSIIAMGGGEKVSSEHVVTDAEDEVLFRVTAKLITMKAVHTGTFLISRRYVVFNGDKYLRIQIRRIESVRLRKYLLMDNSIEIFTEKKQAHFFDFVAGQRSAVLEQLKLLGVKNVHSSDADVHKEVKEVMNLWSDGKISNFEYLMHLNILAGRTYNDLSQYPVFPWILSDYTSEELDLNNPSVYRDLSMPIGAMGKERLEQMKARMGDEEETRYLYGSFYSNAAVVIGYMIRIEPFTTLHIELQSGRFDFEDRLFSSIPAAWNSVRTTSMDFRELIPEFFYLPEFLVNSNGFNLGKRVGDVVLPTWARSPTDFIMKHRAALESPIVSRTLPQWIDLIFGFNSRGLNAEKRNNLFSPYFFETAIRKFPDKVQFIQEYVACFGEAPSQLFSEKHPDRKVMPRSLIDSEPKVAIVYKGKSKGRILALGENNGKVLFVNDHFEVRDLDDRLICTLPGLIDMKEDDMAKLPKLVSISGKLCVYGFPYDFAFYAYAIDHNSIIKIKRVHTREITNVILGPNYYVTSSGDSSIVVWNRANHQQNFILSKHQSPVTCIAMNETCDMLVSCAKEGSIVTATLREGRYLRTIFVEKPPKHVLLSSNGRIYVFLELENKTEVRVFDQNMNSISTGTLDGMITAMELLEEVDGNELLLVMLNTHSLTIMSIPDFQTVWKCASRLSFDIITMHFNRKTQEVLMGTNDGQIVVMRFGEKESGSVYSSLFHAATNLWTSFSNKMGLT